MRVQARDILAALRILDRLDAEKRQASPDERRALMRFGGFGAVALRLFPDPVTGEVATSPVRLIDLQMAVRLLSYNSQNAALLPLLLQIPVGLAWTLA